MVRTGFIHYRNLYSYWNSNIFKRPSLVGGPRRREQTQTTYDDRHLRARNGFVWAIVALAVLAVLFFLGVAAVHYYYPTTMPYSGYPWFGWWFFPFGFIFFLIFIFFIFRVLFWGLGGGRGWRRRYGYGYGYGYGDAREILRQRYARGEITKDQFDQMNRDLEQH